MHHSASGSLPFSRSFRGRPLGGNLRACPSSALWQLARAHRLGSSMSRLIDAESSSAGQGDVRQESPTLVREPEHVPKESTVSLSIGAVDDRVSAGNHGGPQRQRRKTTTTSYQRRGGGGGAGGGTTSSNIRTRTSRSTAARTSLRCGPQPSSEAAISGIVRGASSNSPKYRPSVGSSPSRAAHSVRATSKDLRPASAREATMTWR